MRLSVRTARRALPALCLALAAGCREDDLDLSDVYGTYVLEQAAEGYAASYTDTLFFENHMAWDGLPNAGRQKTTSLELRAAAPAGSTPDSLVVFERGFTFAVRDDEVLINFGCESITEDFCSRPHLAGPLDGDRLTLHPRPEMSVSTRFYRRVAR
jgi:hypothetical protein